MCELVLLHGFLGDARYWDAVHLPAVRPTVAGHGPSPWCPEGDFSAVVEQTAQALLFDHPVWLAGYSLGARLALALALAHPARVAGVLLFSVNPGIEHDADRRARVALDEARAKDLEEQGLEAFVDTWEKLPLFATQRAVSPEQLAVQRARRMTHTVSGIAWALRTLGLGQMPNFWPRLPRVACPVVFVAGELDVRFVEIARRASALVSSSVLHVVPRVGHNVLLEAPQTAIDIIAKTIHEARP